MIDPLGRQAAKAKGLAFVKARIMLQRFQDHQCKFRIERLGLAIPTGPVYPLGPRSIPHGTGTGILVGMHVSILADKDVGWAIRL